MKFKVSLAESLSLSKRPDANLLLTQSRGRGMDFDIEVITFKSRKALEAFNERAGLRPVVYTQVSLNCAIFKHQSDSEARKQLAQ